MTRDSYIGAWRVPDGDAVAAAENTKYIISRTAAIQIRFDDHCRNR